MSIFRHTENTIQIDDYSFDASVINAFDPEYSLPDGCISRHYIQGKKHYLSTGKNQIGGQFPWKKGDFYINSLRELLYLKEQLELDSKIGEK
tara:strand:+ start:225 stop:500 length:276 start_codon:yes stop_codon:yes gene_type:complete